jgi:hypothetical protein
MNSELDSLFRKPNAVLGNANQLILEVIYGMGSGSIILHIPILLKYSPKDKGFYSRGRH